MKIEARLLSRSSQLMIVRASTASDEPSGPPIRTAAVAAVLLAEGVDISPATWQLRRQHDSRETESHKRALRALGRRRARRLSTASRPSSGAHDVMGVVCDGAKHV